jgi:hypothetical protein
MLHQALDDEPGLAYGAEISQEQRFSAIANQDNRVVG